MAHSAAAKQPLAFRVLPSTLEHLRRRAREAGQPQTGAAAVRRWREAAAGRALLA